MLDSLARFHLAQEMEFTAVAYTTYLSGEKSFETRFEQTVTFDDIADALISTSRPEINLACYGTHVPYSVAYLLRIDERNHILTDKSRNKLERYLRDLSSNLESEQLASGHFRFPMQPDFEDESVAAIRFTGHSLEWMAIAKPSLRPSRDCLENAIKALSKDLIAFPSGRLCLGHEYGPRSHAVRAILLLHGFTMVEIKETFSANGAEI